MRQAIGLVGALLLAAALARADGVYIAPVAYPVAPSIPTQRALITYRDGVETLVVESSYQTDSPSVGWILPLPAPPTKLGRADPGLLSSLSMSLRPRITHNLFLEMKAVAVLGVLLMPFAIIVIATRDKRRRKLLWNAGLVVFVLLLLASVLVPTLGTAGSEAAAEGVPGVTELRNERIGNYDVTVLDTANAEALSNWLTAHSLRDMDAKAKAVVNDYVARRWCFLVAHLTRDGGGLATPHPIVAEFPAASIVFPMKLTALADSRTHVELFVVADQQVSAPAFKCVAADRFQQHRAEGAPFFTQTYQAESENLTIGNPDAGEFLWPGCVVTKLVADLKPQQMGEDVQIQQKVLSPHRQHVFSPEGRREVIWVVLMSGGIVLMVAAVMVFAGRRRPPRNQLRVVVSLALVLLLACVGLYVFLPVTPVRSGRELSQMYQYLRTHRLQRVSEMLAGEGLLKDGMSDTELAKFPDLVRKESADLEINPFTGETMRFDRTAGNYSVRRTDGHTYLCFYDADCREYRFELPDK